MPVQKDEKPPTPAEVAAQKEEARLAEEARQAETDRQSNAQNVSTGRKVAPRETSKSEVKTRTADEDETPQSYVHLANGEVLLVNDEDLPGSAGSANPHGHWVKDGSVFQVIGVYPKEEKAEE